MKRDINEVLKQALTPNEEPDFHLNQKILHCVKETSQMEKRTWKRVPAMVLTTALVLGICTVSAYAAWRYLTPGQVAEHLKDSRLSSAFESEGAVKINETQSCGGYDVTLLGMVSGKGLSDYVTTADGELLDDRTYSVVTVEKSDKTPMPDNAEIFVSPFIQGCQPGRYNAASMNGGYSSFLEDGVLYCIAECDNVSAFADRTIYLGVLGETFYNSEAYQYDEATGEIARNESYDGLNALFVLPVDASMADSEAAKALIEAIDTPRASDDGEMPETDADRFMQRLTPENIDEYAKRVESTVMTVTPDADGGITYAYELENGAAGSGTVAKETLFHDEAPGMSPQFSYSCSDADGENGQLVIETFTLNEDGTVTFAAYVANLE